MMPLKRPLHGDCIVKSPRPVTSWQAISSKLLTTVNLQKILAKLQIIFFAMLFKVFLSNL